MMIELSSETPITIAEVPLHIPRRHGRMVHYSTVYRWMTKGVRGRKLESLLIGGVRYTTLEALARFLKLTPQKTAALPESSDDLSSAIESALQDAGV